MAYTMTHVMSAEKVLKHFPADYGAHYKNVPLYFMKMLFQFVKPSVKKIRKNLYDRT